MFNFGRLTMLEPGFTESSFGSVAYGKFRKDVDTDSLETLGLVLFFVDNTLTPVIEQEINL